MTSEQLKDIIRKYAQQLACDALKNTYSASSVQSLDIDTIQTACHYRINADNCRGDFVMLFPKDDVRALVGSFLKNTMGDDHKVSESDIDVCCMEVTNIILGRLSGHILEEELELTVLDPGTTVFPEDLKTEVPEIIGAECLEISPTAGGAGKFYIWSNINKSATKEPVMADEKPSVLIVDDSPVMRAFLEKVFIGNGYRVAATAEDGVEAIEKFEELQPDLVTLDIIMPKMKGTEVLERIMAKKPDAKIIMASSISDARTVMKCLRIGAKRYIIKPYDQEAVLEAVEKALGLEE